MEKYKRLTEAFLLERLTEGKLVLVLMGRAKLSKSLIQFSVDGWGCAITDRTLKDELPRSVGAQYATGDQWRNNSRKNEKTESKQKNKQTTKKHPVVDVTADRSKV